jgi:hypothetical protein
MNPSSSKSALIGAICAPKECVGRNNILRHAAAVQLLYQGTISFSGKKDDHCDLYGR